MHRFYNLLSKRWSLKEFRIFLCKMYALCFVGNIKQCGGQPGGDNKGQGGLRGVARGRGWGF